ncbi:hypothetical protein ACUIJ5_28810 (plasmid) [Bacillus toyonensis]
MGLRAFLKKIDYEYLSNRDSLAVFTSYNSAFQPKDTDYEIDTSIMDEESDTYFALSEVMILKSVILPLLYKAFPNSGKSNVIYVPKTDFSGSIENSDNFKCTLNDENKTEVLFKQVSVHIENDKIVTHIEGEHNIPQYDKIVDFTLDYDSTIGYNSHLDMLNLEVTESTIKSTYNVRDSESVGKKILEAWLSPVYFITKTIRNHFKGENLAKTFINLEQNELTETFNDTVNMPFIIKQSGEIFQINKVKLEQALCIKGIRKVDVK